MISICLEQLSDKSAELRQWACIALGRLWRGYDAARWAGVRDLAHEKMYPLLQHPQPEVRAACAFALGSFIAAGGARTEHANALEQQVAVHLAARALHDASVLVRAEILAGEYTTLHYTTHYTTPSALEQQVAVHLAARALHDASVLVRAEILAGEYTTLHYTTHYTTPSALEQQGAYRLTGLLSNTLSLTISFCYF
ncbi:hypothetical protein evm_015159 [Chilo suppressalis]|nr:hypothetical protein evm_015159 [Chilo suppressalis]